MAFFNVKDVFHLAPIDGRKSFYNKAKVFNFDNGQQALVSYESITTELKDNVLQLTYHGKLSMTTKRHLKSYLN